MLVISSKVISKLTSSWVMIYLYMDADVLFGAIVSAVAIYVNNFMNQDSNSSSSEDEFALEPYLRERRAQQTRQPPCRIKNFIEVVANSSSKEFQSHFRMSRNTFDLLMPQIAPALMKRASVRGKHQIDPEKQFLAVLWLLGTPESYRSVGNRFDMPKSTLFASFFRCIKALNNISHKVIKWPTREERVVIKAQFYQMAHLQGVVGAIDGTYIAIKAPSDNPEVYINRKCYHAITLQAICTPSLAFIDCFTGYPSSVSDARVFKNSDIYSDFINNNGNYFEPGEFIIGDKAYPLNYWCITPYIDRGRLQNMEIGFNTAHARTRQVIERAFALLFGRFRRLRYLDMNRVDLIPATIIATCVLHNICIKSDDELIEFYMNEGMPHVCNNEEVMQIPIAEQNQLRAEAAMRRNELAREVHGRVNRN